MNAHAIEILDDLTVVADRQVVGRLDPSQAFDMAEQLVRLGMRRIMVEEGAGAIDHDDLRQPIAPTETV